MEVLVFATSVKTKQEADKLAPVLNAMAGNGNWNFALDDRDKILRIISEQISSYETIQALQQQGFTCTELTD
jgi:hypothetical protein